MSKKKKTLVICFFIRHGITRSSPKKNKANLRNPCNPVPIKGKQKGLNVISACKFHQVGLDETIYLTVHYPPFTSGSLEIGTVVFHAAVVEHVTADCEPHSIFFLPASTFACSAIRC